CRLTNKDGKIVFFDDAEQATQLRPGRNIIGRDASCDILINSAYREISRKHLILELSEDTKLRVTDISSHGTSLNPRFLENTSI
ncbi:MAG: pSer/pThr/pTyr-binding forkhead associated (FHA) protein, partial [Gammaproteobacteria bacterium]